MYTPPLVMSPGVIINIAGVSKLHIHVDLTLLKCQGCNSHVLTNLALRLHACHMQSCHNFVTWLCQGCANLAIKLQQDCLIVQ